MDKFLITPEESMFDTNSMFEDVVHQDSVDPQEFDSNAKLDIHAADITSPTKAPNEFSYIDVEPSPNQHKFVSPMPFTQPGASSICLPTPDQSRRGSDQDGQNIIMHPAPFAMGAFNDMSNQILGSYNDVPMMNTFQPGFTFVNTQQPFTPGPSRTPSASGPSPSTQAAPAPESKKRRRSEAEEESEEEEDEAEAKHKESLRRNRQAASKCREKKKAMIDKLEHDAGFLQQRNVYLTNHLWGLKMEVARLWGMMSDAGRAEYYDTKRRQSLPFGIMQGTGPAGVVPSGMAPWTVPGYDPPKPYVPPPGVGQIGMYGMGSGNRYSTPPVQHMQSENGYSTPPVQQMQPGNGYSTSPVQQRQPEDQQGGYFGMHGMGSGNGYTSPAQGGIKREDRGSF